jgi:hypothetical protein
VTLLARTHAGQLLPLQPTLPRRGPRESPAADSADTLQLDCGVPPTARTSWWGGTGCSRASPRVTRPAYLAARAHR